MIKSGPLRHEMLRTLFFSIWFALHPVHITMTSIDYNPEKDVFDVFVRMYFDDFLLDSKLNGNVVQKEGFSGTNSASMEIMEKYLRDKIIIKVNGKQLSVKLSDMNLSDNEVSMNLEYKNEKKPKTISVKNLIMTGLYSDQANMIILRIKDFEEGVKLTSDLKEQTFNIK
jgi:hypothetical protein